MIQMIQTALTYGYTANQILKYVASKFKQAAPGIQQAKQQGYSDEDILKFLGNKIKPKNPKGVDEDLSAQERYMKAVGMKTKAEKEETRNKFLKGALGVAGTAAAAYSLYQNFGNIANTLGNTFGAGGTAPPPNTPPALPTPGQAVNPPPNIPQTPGQMATPTTPTPGPNIGQQIQAGVQQPINQGMQPVNVGMPTPPPSNVPQESFFSQMTKGVNVDALSEEDKRQIQFLNLIADKLQAEGKTFDDPAVKKIENKVKSVLKGKSGILMQEATRGVTPESNIEELTSPYENMVAVPGGIGELKGEKNGKASVKLGDKTIGIAAKDAIKPPKEAAIEALELIKSFTPEQERSTHHMLNAYDDQTKQGFFVFHNGNAYVVDDITPDEYKELSEEIELAKTSGENIIGKWTQGEGSRGSAYNKIVKGVRDRKVNKDLAKKYRKLKVGYNILREFQRLLNEK